MAKIINISNHTLTTAQMGGFDGVIELPSELKIAWGQIDPKTISAKVGAVIRWLEAIVPFGGG